MFSDLFKSERSATPDAVAAGLRRLVPKCSICNETIDGHRYVKLAIACEKDPMIELLSLTKAHRWSELREIQNWDPMKNAIIAYAVLGSHSRGMVILEMNPFELYQADEIFGIELLEDDEALSATFNDPLLEWKAL